MAEQKTSPIKGREYKNVIVISLSFFVVFTSYVAIQNLQSSLNQEQSLGVISLSTLYGCLVFSAIFAPTFIKFTGIKRTIIVAWIAHVIYTSSNFYPSFYTLVPSSVLLGAVSGTLWTALSTYISTCASSKSESANSSLYNVLSRMNGIFFVLFQSTQITGNLISSLVLQQGTYNTTGTDVSFCGPSDCPAAMGNHTVITRPEEKVVYVLLGVFLVCGVTGLVITLFFLDPVPKSACVSSLTLKTSVTSCVRILCTSRLMFLVPLFMFEAMELGIMFTDFTKSYVSCPLGIRMVGFVMAVYGLSTAVFTFVFSRLAKFFGRVLLFSYAGSVNGGLLLFILFWHPKSDDLVFVFIIVMLWGMADGVWETQINAMLALMFPDKKEPVFANFHTWKSIGFTMTLIYGSFLCVNVKLIVALGLLLVAMLLYYGVEIYLKLCTKSFNIETSETAMNVSTVTQTIRDNPAFEDVK